VVTGERKTDNVSTAFAYIKSCGKKNLTGPLQLSLVFMTTSCSVTSSVSALFLPRDAMHSVDRAVAEHLFVVCLDVCHSPCSSVSKRLNIS